MDAKFVCYLINESDFIDIIMSDIKEMTESLPSCLDPKDHMGNYNIQLQIQEKSPRLLKQFEELQNACLLISQIFASLDLQAKKLHEQRRRALDFQSQLRSIAIIEKAFLESYVQIVLIDCFQEKFLDGSKEEVRTHLQYLVEIVALIEVRQFSLVTFSFLDNSLSPNFDRYISDHLRFKPPQQWAPAEGQARKSHAKIDGVRNVDLRETIRNLYPEQDTTSKFSICNPYARFTMSGTQLRETVKTYRQHGKDETQDVIPLQMRRGIEPDKSLAKTMQVYEQIMNVSITGGLATQNIDDLFLKAQSLEEQAKEEDDVYRKFQLENQFKLIAFIDQHCKLIRAKLFESYLTRSSPTISTVVLKLLQQLLKISTLPWFIK